LIYRINRPNEIENDWDRSKNQMSFEEIKNCRHNHQGNQILDKNDEERFLKKLILENQ
jgi:hypothetical protein